jgi:hypothetical protein
MQQLAKKAIGIEIHKMCESQKQKDSFSFPGENTFLYSLVFPGNEWVVDPINPERVLVLVRHSVKKRVESMWKVILVLWLSSTVA